MNSFSIANPESVDISSDSLQKMDVFFHQLVDEQQLAGIQTSIMRHGKLVHFDSYGYSNIDEQILLDESSIFRIFSMTKPIVSVALMQLYEEGLFSLEDPLSKFLTEFEHMNVATDTGLIPAERSIKIIDILRHTSGFGYGRGQDTLINRLYADASLFSSNTNKEFALKVSKLPLHFEPGTDWQYGVSTNICGHLVEVLSGQSLQEYLYEHIFSPLDMMDTHFQLPKNKIDRFTVGYGWHREDGLTVTESQRDNRYINNVTLFNGGGGLVSTSLDYLKFCQMIHNGGLVNENRILKKETIDLMLQDHLEEVRTFQDRFRLPLGEYGFGLGFAIRGQSAHALDKVYGWGGAVGTYFKIDTERDLTYMIMIQLSPYRQLGLRQLLQDFVEASILK